MTPEEKEVLKERIKNAENLERRIGNLQDARDKLQEKEISGLKFIFNEEDSGLLQVFYKNHGDEKFYRICWLDGESDLATIVLDAISDIIDDRLGEVRRELEKI